VKRVHHDVILPQATVQNTYARLKAKYARNMIASWVEATDPTKHVFEDLGIAAFLIELWNEMYASGTTFPGFVDIGCGNGLLVHILLEEGYKGWGFDARRRKSWGIYSQKTQENLKEMVLIPTLVQQDNPSLDRPALEGCLNDLQLDGNTATSNIHNGEFPIGTFIISNHADELTPWTPLLAKMSDSPFIAIPCCSHNLTGAKFRAPPPKEIGASSSTYASLVAWVSDVASDCGWEVEKEMLRIPSTRNTAILGRAKNSKYRTFDADTVIQKHGGFMGWEENAMKLVKTGPRGH
jgi:tRNASer (uridine44-2'-O)-methyltransferase